MRVTRHPIDKIKTGISGFDDLSEGGLPKGRAAVISGAAGSGKTLFGMEFLYRGVTEFKENGVFVTFEERRTDLRKDVQSFGWNVDALEKQGKIAFVDASGVAEHQVEVGEYDLGALITRIRFAVRKVKAKRVVIDSVAALFLRYNDQTVVRRELFKIIDVLRRLNVTTIITAERVRDEDATSRFGVEDFVVDSVISLYNTPVGRERERQIEITKQRGASYQSGKHPFLISSSGITVFPNVVFAPPEGVRVQRISTGVPGIDAMTDGGVYRGSTTLLMGPSGTGRTVLGLHFLAEGARVRERGLLISFEEAASQLIADANSLGWNFGKLEKAKRLHVVALQPEGKPIEAYLKRIRIMVADFGAKRVVIDSLTPIARIVDEQRFRRFVVALNAFFKKQNVTALINYTTDGDNPKDHSAESDLAVVADNIFVMRVVESAHSIDREMIITKSRASSHEPMPRRYRITSEGMRVIAEDEDIAAPKSPKKVAKNPVKRAKSRKS
jgi:circadian clock protein KaiC